MDKINFLAKDSFPLSSDTMARLQQMIDLSANTASLGGANYILSGCVDDGANVSDGIIVINGEILPFKGGAKQAKITIKEESETLTAFGINYLNAYVTRTAAFLDPGEYPGAVEYNWEDFAQVLTNKQLEDKISKIYSAPVGSVQMWSGDAGSVPDPYLLCNGNLISKIEYSELYTVIGDQYGVSGNSFRTPNLKGLFVVGYHPENEDYNEIGKTGGSERVKLMPEEMPIHSHNIQFVEKNWGDNANNRPFPDPAGTSGYTAQTTSAGGDKTHENRPPYFVLAYIIKAK